MAITYSNNSPVDKGYLLESKTDHDIQEAYPGERFQPIIQNGERFMAAPYLPFISGGFVKEFETYAVIRRYKLVSMDEQGQVVPANGILKVFGPLDGTTDTYYDARPCVYSSSAGGIDTGSGTYGELNVANGPVNMNGFTGGLLTAGAIDASGCVTAAAVGTATDAGIAGRQFVGVSSARFPIGVVTDKVLSRAGVYQYREFDPQRTLTVLTHRVLLVAEKTVNRYNYGQATRKAILFRNASLTTAIGAGRAATIDLVNASMPAWANQGVDHATNPALQDIILPGDLVASDDDGNFVRFDVRVDSWNSVDETVGAATLGANVNQRYPVAAVHAVAGRCMAREKVVGDTALNLVKTYKDSADVGGSGTAGVEKILTRGTAMTAGEVTSISAVTIADSLPGQADLTTDHTEWDAEADAKYALLIKLSI